MAALVLAATAPSGCQQAGTTTTSTTQRVEVNSTQRVEVNSGGGSPKSVVKIHADDGVCWAGTVGTKARSGCGDASFPASGSGVMATIVKTDGAGGVSVLLIVDGRTVDRAVGITSTTLTVTTNG
jgi:hypothetical protein